MGAASRANSVRFDETANQGHWAHASRSSVDLIPRVGSGLAMTDRSYSHKSDGRQSSAGHSVHSMASGRANSLGLDSNYGGLNSSSSPLGTPGLAPGLFVLGSVPAIIRCWLNTNFKHNSLLYAAVCSGSYASHIDSRLVQQLGFEDQVTLDLNGERKIRISVYLPEAIPHPASSRSNSPAPQVPTLTISFLVSTQSEKEETSKAIQVFIGSDVLRAHNADILLSSNTLSMYDDDRSKLSIPLVRPEDERTFKPLRVGSVSVPGNESVSPRDGNDTVDTGDEADRQRPQPAIALPPGFPATPSNTAQHVEATDSSLATATNASASVTGSEDESGSTRRSIDARPILAHLNTKAEPKDSSDGNAASNSALRSGTSPNPNIWGNWRRESEQKSSAPLDWANQSKSSSTSYQRRDQGIKVLRPSKTPSRTFSSGGAQASSPSFTGQSRFFDDGKRRQSATAGASESNDAQLKRSVSGSSSTAAASSASKEPQSALSKPRSANPIGGASAFSWLKTGQTE